MLLNIVIELTFLAVFINILMLNCMIASFSFCHIESRDGILDYLFVCLLLFAGNLLLFRYLTVLTHASMFMWMLLYLLFLPRLISRNIVLRDALIMFDAL